MIHQYVTCDQCFDTNEFVIRDEKGFAKRGVFIGTWKEAARKGWKEEDEVHSCPVCIRLMEEDPEASAVAGWQPEFVEDKNLADPPWLLHLSEEELREHLEKAAQENKLPKDSVEEAFRYFNAQRGAFAKAYAEAEKGKSTSPYSFPKEE